MVYNVLDVVLFMLISFQHLQNKVLGCGRDVNVVRERYLVGELMLMEKVRFVAGHPSTLFGMEFFRSTVRRLEFQWPRYRFSRRTSPLEASEGMYTSASRRKWFEDRPHDRLPNRNRIFLRHPKYRYGLLRAE